MIRTIDSDLARIEGPILGHEHLRIDLTHNKNADVVLGPNEEADIIGDLAATVADHGLALVVDLTVPGSGRDMVALRRIGRGAGVAVVGATGFYWEPFPPPALEKTQDQLTDIMIGEIVSGVGDSGIRCGVIKIGTPDGAPDATSEKLFRAAVAASQATGAAVITHTSSLDQIAWHQRIMRDGGLDPARLLISHFGRASLEFIKAAGAYGSYMGIDQIGFSIGPDYDALADLVCGACAAGLADQMIISSDMARRTRLRSYGGTSYGTMFTHFLPRLAERGLSAAQINGLMNANPCRLLDIKQ